MRNLGLIGIFAIMISCSQSIYVANVANTSFFEEKGETDLAAHSGPGGVEVQVAHAVSPKYFVSVSGTYADWDSLGQDIPRYKQQYWQVGVGSFESFAKYGRIQHSIGYGQGKTTTFTELTFIDEDQEVHVDSYYRKLFYQYSVAFHYKIVTVGGAFRWSLLDFYNFDSNKGRYDDHIRRLFFEPAVVARFGFDKVKFQAQVGLSLMTGRYAFDYDPFFATVGIVYRTNLLK